MEFSTEYNLDLPVPMAKILKTHLEEHHEKLTRPVGIEGPNPKAADFIVPGILHIPNLIYFTDVSFGITQKRCDFKEVLAEDSFQYARRFDQQDMRMTVSFTAWQVVTNL